MHFRNAIKKKKKYTKRHNSSCVKCRESPENCVLCAQDKAEAILAATKGENQFPEQFQIQEMRSFTTDSSVYIQNCYTACRV